MCGIAGAVGLINQDIIEGVVFASNALAHRGPDGSDIWKHTTDQSGVVLAHRRLAILDLLARSDQPMIDPQTKCVLTYNGEIFNYVSLRQTLENKGYVFETTGDTEVILKSFIEWGKDCVNYLEGMFAFAIYDPKNQSTFLARDPSGIKPLYYTTVKHSDRSPTLIFASEVRAILATGFVDRQIDPEALSSYLWNGFVVEPATIVKEVFLLQAGHTMTVSSSATIEYAQYWKPKINETKSLSNHKEIFNAFENIVEQHLVSDVPIGVFLSGGVDSSFIAALAAKSTNKPLNTFCITFSESEYSESVYAKKVAEAIGANHYEFQLSADYFSSHLEDALSSLDQPTFDGINSYYVSRAVAEHGIKVAIAGTGGDELFGGYSSFVDIPKFQKWSKTLTLIPSAARKMAGSLGTRFLQGNQSVPPQTRWGKIEDLLCGDITPISAYQTSYALFNKKFLSQLSPSFYDRLNSGLTIEMIERVTESTSGGTPEEMVSIFETNMFLGQRLLRDTDSCSMNVSLEVRVPLVGKAMFDLVNSIPNEIRFNPIGKKMLLRNAVKDKLPDGIFDRPKQGFELPMAGWLRSSLFEHGRALFFDETLVSACGLDPSTTSALWLAFQKGEKGLYWSRIWSVYVLLWWCNENKMTI